MSDSVQDDVSSRFRSIWVGLLVLLSFGILSVLAVVRTTKDPTAVDSDTARRAEARIAALQEVRAQQEPLIEKAAFIDEAAGTVRLPVDEAVSLVLPELQAKKPAASQAVVLGSPTQLKQMQQPAPTPEAPPKDAKPADAKPADAAPKTDPPKQN